MSAAAAMNTKTVVDDTNNHNADDDGEVIMGAASVPQDPLSVDLLKPVSCSDDETLRTLATAMSSTCSITSLWSPATPSRRSGNIFSTTPSRTAESPCSPANIKSQRNKAASSPTTSNGGAGLLCGGKNAARQRRNSWMRSSVVRRAASVVDEEVAALCEKSPFLSSVKGNTTTTNNVDIAELHRMEIRTGSMLGMGGFAEVFEVTSVELVDNSSDNDDEDDPVQCRRRRLQMELQQSSSPAAPKKYAVKLLKKRLLQNTKEFQHAAIDLAVESKYLSALQHPHIVKVRALAVGGTAAFKKGMHDDYFIVMDLLHETLEQRIQNWQQQQQLERRPSPCQLGNVITNDNGNSSNHYRLSLKYALQIADALQYLHDKSIVYRDLKPQNIGFKQNDDGGDGDTLQIFDFGLCRELPKPNGQTHHDDELEDEETFQMSGVGTQRYMAPEIINSRKYNLKADVYSWSMVVLELMTLEKPFAAYAPKEHQVLVAGLGERPILRTKELDTSDMTHLAMADASDLTNDLSIGDSHESNTSDVGHITKISIRKVVLAQHWPVGVSNILEHAWSQNVSERWSMSTVFHRLQPIVCSFEETNDERSTEH